jgi:lysophospholipase L1-like esterase
VMKKLIIFVLLTSMLSVSGLAQSSKSDGNKFEKKPRPDFLKPPMDTTSSDIFSQVVADTTPSRILGPVVLLGDSITGDWDLTQSFPGMPFINQGFGGDTTPGMRNRFQADVIDLHPKTVIIEGGTNDIAGFSGPMTVEQTAANIAFMANKAREQRIYVVLATVLPVNDYCLDEQGHPIIQTAIRPPERIRALNDLIRAIAVQNQYPILDYYSAVVDEQGFFRMGLSIEGLHPNDNGHAVMQPLVPRAILAAQKRR